MLAAASAHYRLLGRDRALAAFNNGEEPFFDRDLHVFCITHAGVISADGKYPHNVGDDISTSLLAESILSEGFSNPFALDFTQRDPSSGEEEPVVMYVGDLGEDVCTVSAYNPP